MTREIGAAALLVLIAGAFWAGWEWRDRSADIAAAKVVADANAKIAEMAKAEADAQAKARNAEHRLAERNSEIEQKLAQELNNAKRREQNRVADLERGAVRLRREIGALHTERLSSSAAAAGELSQEARRGAELVAAAIAVGAACDAQVRGLQEAYEALRRPAP